MQSSVIFSLIYILSICNIVICLQISRNEFPTIKANDRKIIVNMAPPNQPEPNQPPKREPSPVLIPTVGVGKDQV